MRTLKPSIYNLKFNSHKRLLAFNVFRGSLLIVPKQKTHRIVGLFDGQSKINERDVLQLHHLGFLVQVKKDEKAFLKARFWRHKYIDKTMRMMICTTFACNFRCDYCFEGLPPKKSSVRLSNSVQSSIIHLVESRMHEVDTLKIHWFGGEPLLNTSPIFKLGSRLRKLAESHGVVWDAEVITNGYFLDANMAERLKEAGVDKAQVTFDGCQSDHDSRRYTNGKKPTFDRILNQIISWQDIIEPKIRVNTDRRNIKGMYEFVDQLVGAGLSRRARFHFGMTRNFSQNTIKSDELGAREFRKLIHPVYRYAISKGLNIDYGTSLLPKATVCNAMKRNTLHVGTDGTIWKCFPLIGTQRGHCGTVFNQNDTTEDMMRYESFDPFSDPICDSCNLLPLCMGRCPHKDMCLNINNSMCDFYDLEEIKERLEIVIATNNRNNNVSMMESLS